MDRATDVRIWRLRKRNLYVDAELRQVGETGEFESARLLRDDADVVTTVCNAC